VDIDLPEALDKPLGNGGVLAGANAAVPAAGASTGVVPGELPGKGVPGAEVADCVLSRPGEVPVAEASAGRETSVSRSTASRLCSG